MTTPTMTRAQLINQVAYILGVLAEGQTIESDASSRIDERIDPVVLSLSTRGIVDITNTNDINTEWFLELADCVADACAAVFGIPRNPAMVLMAEDKLALMARRNDAANRFLQADRGTLPRISGAGFTYARWASGF